VEHRCTATKYLHYNHFSILYGRVKTALATGRRSSWTVAAMRSQNGLDIAVHFIAYTYLRRSVPERKLAREMVIDMRGSNYGEPCAGMMHVC
jgi:hypothetical protein